MKSTKFNTRDFLFGFMTGALIVALFAFMQLRSIVGSNVNQGTVVADNGTQGSLQSSSSSETLTVYNTDIVDWSVTANDGTEFNFKTPTGYYSLTDQYVSSLKEYYNTDVTDDNLVCVGDAASQYEAAVLINAATLSKTKSVVDMMYADVEDVDTSAFKYSEAYQYMTSGSMPEDSENVTVQELDPIVSSAEIEYRVFHVERDTEYYTDDTMAETELIHSVELTAYSQNEDAVEVLVYMQEYNEDEALRVLKEFIN